MAVILNTFPIVKRKDEATFNGGYRTKRVILERRMMNHRPRLLRRAAMKGSIRESSWRQQPAFLPQAFPTPRAAEAYIMDTFPIVKRNDEDKFINDTNRTILEIYDTLAESMQSGRANQTHPNSL